MKRFYESPEFEVLKCEMGEMTGDVLQASIEKVVPDESMPSDVPGGPEIPDF